MEEKLRVVARFGLPAAPVPVVQVRAEEMDTFLSATRRHRLQGLVAAAAWYDRIDGPEGLLQVVEAEHVRALSTCLAIEQRAVAVVAALSPIAGEPRVLKGAALAHLDYPDPSLRVFADLDLLVANDGWGASLAILREAGFERTLPAVRRGWDAQFAKGATLRDKSGFELDLHRSLASGRHGLTIDLDELLEGSDHFQLGGSTMSALDGSRRLVHACLHAVLGTPSGYRGLRDIAQLLFESKVDWERSLRLAERWQLDAPVALGVLRCFRLLELDASHGLLAWAASANPSPAQVRALGAARSGGLRREIQAALDVIPGPVRKTQFILGPLVPTRAHLRARGLTRRAHLRSVLSGRPATPRRRSVSDLTA